MRLRRAFNSGNWVRMALLAGCLALGWSQSAWAQSPASKPRLRSDMPPPRPDADPAPLFVADRMNPQSPAAQHPLVPALQWAKAGIPVLEKIQDYSAVLVKREKIDGKLRGPEYLFVKVRHQPFSVYVCFLAPASVTGAIAPASVKGTECIYVEGQNNGKMWAHPPGIQNKLIGTLSLDPRGRLAMSGNRHPLTELGLANLISRLVEVGEHDMQFGECEVKFIEGAKVNDMVCTCVQVVHPVPRRDFLFHMARIYVNNATTLPVRFENYEWPETPGGPPQLMEEYTYIDLKINNGFTDFDFDINNPNYQFKAR